MCLSIPSKVTKIDKEKNTATVDTMGVSRDASLDLTEEGSVDIGDYVLIHIGFVMNKIDEQDALDSLETYREILEALGDEELQQTINESDNCPSVVKN
ncbi:MAG: HypC/HybG/HupF family hydrogenase formation chaperone [Campylobacterota bacterium]|nr:HypC/HybG/HupF family hydrogenase formation chaperone [Campylobacterota bacterium]